MTDTILFVDDHPNILAALKRMLHGMRSEWDMQFASCAADAFEIFEKKPVDVIVTDMRMPGMDGAALLTKIREDHPGTVRIILSGYSDKDTVYRTVLPAHQYLAKPCDAESLIDTIKRVLKLQGLLGSQELRLMVAETDRLPAVPSIYSKLIDHLSSNDATADSIAAIIGQDLAMMAQVQKLTNSSFFGLPNSVSSAHRAVHMLGVDTIKQLALNVGFFVPAKNDPAVLQTIETLSKRSMRIGTIAREIAKAEGCDELTVDLAGTAGELSQIGSLMLISEYPKKYAEAREITKREKVGVIEAEQRVFGSGHAQVAAYLLGLWGFEERVVRAAAFHHQPRESKCQEFGALAAVHAAQFFASKTANPADGVFPAATAIDIEYFESMSKRHRFDLWYDIAANTGAQEVLA